MKPQSKLAGETPVRIALAHIGDHYDVTIEERLTFELDLTTRPDLFDVSPADDGSFGLVGLEATDFEALALARETESVL